MTRPPSQHDPHAGFRPGSQRIRLAIGILALVVVAAGAFGAWYLFLRPAGPAPVDLGALPPPSSTASSGSSAIAPGATPAASTSSPAASFATLDGTWNVDTSIGSGATGSFVGYRVQEQLASIGANIAVGRTPKVSGSFTLTGTKITAASITADLTALASDDPRRDGQLQSRGLETSTYTTATFVLSQPLDIGVLPSDGQIVSVTAAGRLTLHGVTKSVQVPLQARLSGTVVTVTGSLQISFADYGITPPTSFIALSVVDNGTLELQLMFTHA